MDHGHSINNRTKTIVTSNSVTIGGMRVSALSKNSWAEVITAECLAHREVRGLSPPAYFTSANGNVLSQYARSAQFRKSIDMADGIDADGMSLVLASRILTNRTIPERCCTTDFIIVMTKKAIECDLTYYILGGNEEVNYRASTRLSDLFPELRIVGRSDGFFSSENESAVIEKINEVTPDILWVGLGVPYEQEFVARNLGRLTNVGVVKTCGGLLDYLSGDTPRAPNWMQEHGIEWLFRLSVEPRRLWKRYLITNLHALYLILSKSHRS